jgi:hypothetical protein
MALREPVDAWKKKKPVKAWNKSVEGWNKSVNFPHGVQAP